MPVLDAMDFEFNDGANFVSQQRLAHRRQVTDDVKERSRVRTWKHHMNTELFIENLSFNTTENDLQDAFAAHGTVIKANLMMDRASGRPRGFAHRHDGDARRGAEGA